MSSYTQVPSLKSVGTQLREANVTRICVLDMARLGPSTSPVLVLGTRNGRVVTFDTRSGVEAEVCENRLQ